MFYRSEGISSDFLQRKAAVTGQPFLVEVHLSSNVFSTPFPQPRNLFLETAKLPPKIWSATAKTVVSNISTSLVQRK